MFAKTCLILVSAAALAVPAVAADPQVTRAVQFTDLNLESDAGRTELQRRLVRAAKSMCDTNPVLESATVRAERERCETATAAQFEGQIAAAIQANRARSTAYASN